GVVRLIGEPGYALEYAAQGEVARQRIRPVHLDLGLTLERRDDVAVQQSLRGIDDKAGVAHRAPGIQGGIELATRAEPCVEAHGKEIRMAPLPVVVVRRPGDQKLTLTELLRRHVIQPAYGLPPAVRKSRIGGRINTKRTEVRGGARQVVDDARVPHEAVGRAEKSGPVAIIAAAHRQPRSQLVLHFNPKVPEVIAVAEPADKIR